MIEALRGIREKPRALFLLPEQKPQRAVPTFAVLRRSRPAASPIVRETQPNVPEPAAKPHIPSSEQPKQRQKDAARFGKTFAWYFERFPVKAWEAHLYKNLGITLLKKYNPNDGQFINNLLRKHTNKPKLDPTNKASLEDRIQKTKKGERDHVIEFLGVAAVLGVTLAIHAAPIILVGGILMQAANVSSIMLQRFNRFLATEKLKNLPKS